jgi:gluconolactonase
MNTELNAAPVATDLGLIEGPVLTSSGELVVVSIDRGHLYRIADGAAKLLVVTGGGPNGAAEGHGGALFIAQNGGVGLPGDLPAPRPLVHRRPPMTGGVQIVHPSGGVQWLTQDPIAPNDLCLGPDGLLYVTDPTRGRFDDGRVWRCDPATGESELLTSVSWYPNGIGFGLEDDAVYVASSGERSIKRLALAPSGLGPAETVIEMDAGIPDGFAFDAEGNIVIGAVGDTPDTPGSIQTWTLDGELLDEYRPGPSRYYTNVALGPDRRLVITDTSTGTVLVAEDWPHAGLALHPFRGRP